MRVRFRKEQDMAKKKGTGVSPITNRIYYGTQDTEPYKSIYNLDTGQEEEIHDSYGDLLKWLQSEAEEISVRS